MLVFRLDGQIDFFTMHGDVFWCVDAEFDLVFLDFEELYFDGVADHDAFVFLTRQNEH